MVNTRPPLLYRIIQWLVAPATACYFLSRWVLKRSYRPFFLERFGRLPKSFSRTRPGSIWLHAVSVGEVASAVPLLRELRDTFPGVPLYLSVSTVPGRKAAERQAAALVEGLFYSPIDYASMVRRTLAAIRPALLIVLETEIWPNLFFETVRTGARLVVVNGRISNRTWPQYQAMRWFFCRVLQWPDLVLVQSENDLNRYRTLGVPGERLSVAGNLKYDAACSARPVDVPTFGATKIWIAASTVGPNEHGSMRRHFVDEDDLVLDAFAALQQEFPRLLLILAPRQPYRFPNAVRKLQSRGISFVRRSRMEAGVEQALPLPGVLLLDTIGELAGLYALADVVFVGGSIAPRGGHNILEPAAMGVPIITGVHMQNFESIAKDFAAADAFVQVTSGATLAMALREMLMQPEPAAEMGRRGQRLVRQNRGVAAMVARRCQELYYSASLTQPRSAWVRWFLAPVAFLWKHGGRFKRDRSEQRASTLRPVSVPVISVGGITVGGAGKTPFVNYLSGALQRRGFCPAILTRGYRRRYPAEHLVFAAGAEVSPFYTGDEAQILLRAANAPIGIGARRYETASILMRQFPDTDVMMLDDGFQNALMPRDLDIVLIDGLDPFGHEEIVPLGRLREPLDALERADIFVVTRVTNEQRFEAIRSRLLGYNAHAPVFRTRLVPRGWHDYRSGGIMPALNSRKVGAFCGLGNPQSFWDTLDALDLDVVFRWSFGDHHSYKPAELYRVAQQAKMHGAEILVTTEKDRINCPSHLGKIIWPLSLAWLEIELEMEDEGQFLSHLERLLGVKV